jgi:hypothetical protein
VFYFFFFINVISKEGNNTRLVMVAVIRVSEVSQPSDCVPTEAAETENDKASNENK